MASNIVLATTSSSSTTTTKAMIASHEECLRNFGAKHGHYVFDGCGEFMKKGEDGTPEAFICDACGCHRNFHRKIEPKQPRVHRRTTQNASVPPLHLYRHNLIMRAAAKQARAQVNNGIIVLGEDEEDGAGEETSSEGSGIRASFNKYP